MFSHPLTATAELRPLEIWNDGEFAAHLDRAREFIRPWVSERFATASAMDTLSRFAEWTAHDAQRLFGIWDDGILVGGVMYTNFSAKSGTCELGCWLEPAAEGRGLITLACKVLLDWAFNERGIHRAEWECRADNARSAAVAERLGMTLDGVIRETWKVGDAFYDKQVWSILSSDRQ